jgi:CRISPR-associated endonuclease Cas1
MGGLTGWLRRRRPAAPALPSDAEPEPAADPWPIADEAAPVHILGDHGAVRLEDGRLSIAVNGDEPARLRLDDVAAVFLHGGVSVTTPAMLALMRRGVPLIWHGHDGRLVGHATGLGSVSAAVREAQFAAAADPARRLGLAAAFVDAKIGASRRLVRRRLGASHPVCRRLDVARRRAASAASLDELRGFEGAAADAYFGVWAEMLGSAGPHLAFVGRSRRPPADPLNAVLSYLYAILHGRCVAAALGAELEPAVGFLHARRAGRYSLALDLMEPFRPLVTDAALLAAANNGEFPPDHFAPPASVGSGWRLSPQGRRTALAIFERRLAQETSDVQGRVVCLRHALTFQARDLARALRTGSAFEAFGPAR